MANGHGGSRPNAGRKPKRTEQYQVKMRAIIEETVTAQDWRDVVKMALQDAKDGDKDARRWLAPWVVGAEPKEVTVKGDEDAPMVVRVEYCDG